MYLDPHTCQPYVDLARPDSSDESFHCNSPWWMDITQLDPSVAVVSTTVVKLYAILNTIIL